MKGKKKLHSNENENAEMKATMRQLACSLCGVKCLRQYCDVQSYCEFGSNYFLHVLNKFETNNSTFRFDFYFRGN